MNGGRQKCMGGRTLGRCCPPEDRRRCRTGRAALGAGAGWSLRHAPTAGRARLDPRRRRSLGRAQQHVASTRNRRGAQGASARSQCGRTWCKKEASVQRGRPWWAAVGHWAQKADSCWRAWPPDTLSTCSHCASEALAQRRRDDLSARCGREGRLRPAPASSGRARTTSNGSRAGCTGRRSSRRRLLTRRLPFARSGADAGHGGRYTFWTEPAPGGLLSVTWTP